ncbi:MAG: universal stress protein [Deltaproteobacteria bacterium]|nr:universal stress protein [Deltaproteobacteria bacterium]
MFQRILVVFENEEVSCRALSYAQKLAHRMDSEVGLLMLVEMAFADRAFLGSKRNSILRLENRIGKALGRLSSGFLEKGISVSVALRIGDPAQELFKFLAERPSFQAVIWGSHETLPHRNRPKRRHWIEKVSDSLECPLLEVAAKPEQKVPDVKVR